MKSLAPLLVILLALANPTFAEEGASPAVSEEEAAKSFDDLMKGKHKPAKKAEPAPTVEPIAPVEPQPQPATPTATNDVEIPTPVVAPKKKHQAGVEQQLLQGQASENIFEAEAVELGGNGKPRDPSLAPLSRPVLQGNASKSDTTGGELDPDMDDRELQIEWDKWRNKFLRAVQMSVQEAVNNPNADEFETPRYNPHTMTVEAPFPLGIGTIFVCQILPDRTIVNFQILKTSGYAKYDQLVKRAVHDLEGSALLTYPRGSRRKAVTQAASIKTAERNEYQYHHFGDVERQRVHP